MSADLVALVAGTVLAVGALAFVLHPLFFAVRDRPSRARSTAVNADDSAIVALREIEFDRATGKLSDIDYVELRKQYGDQAIREMRGTQPTAPPDASVSLDAIEARVRAYRQTHRECVSCGLRPETDAVYCSTCGTYLQGRCPACSAVVAESGAAFCSSCGVPLSDAAASGAFA